MIFGTVDSALEARISLFIEDTSGQSHPFEGIVDTGYSGYLSLPPAFITTLGLPWLSQQQAFLADGSSQFLEVYAATLIWESQARRIRVNAVKGEPLIGMKLLEGHEIRIRVVAGGPVLIDAVP